MHNNSRMEEKRRDVGLMIFCLSDKYVEYCLTWTKIPGLNGKSYNTFQGVFCERLGKAADFPTFVCPRCGDTRTTAKPETDTGLPWKSLKIP